MPRDQPLRIAMWSGPRNISTAMMRAWGNREDTAVCDEPFYAHYLSVVPVDHPGVDEVVARHETDWRKVVSWLTGPVPEGKRVFYQKHMAHHLLPHMERSWMRDVASCFLIRDPAEMLTSLLRKMPDPKIEDTGLPQQVEIFESVRTRDGRTPPVVDSRDVLDDPAGMLESLCDALELPFTSRMLSWPPGHRETDGVWARYWYDAVERSTGFEPYRPKPDRLPPGLEALHAECREHYETLHAHRLRPRGAR